MDLDARNALIEAHLWMCSDKARVAYHKIRRRLPYDDLLGYAYLALVRAAGRYDPARGVTFRTFISQRIAGGIIDGIRHETKTRSGRVAPARESVGLDELESRSMAPGIRR